MAVGDSEPAIRQLMTSGGYAFPLMIDGGSVAAAYDISVIPTLFVIDAQGEIRESISGMVSADDLVGITADLVQR